MKEQEGLDGYDYYDGQPKWPVRRIVKYAATVISIIMYIVIFIRILGACDNSLSESILLDKNQKASFENSGSNVCRIYADTPDDDGRIQFQYVTSLPDIKIFQLTLKFNSNHHSAKDISGYKFILKKTSENGETAEYSENIYKTVKRVGYIYMRISFPNVEFSQGDTLTLKICGNDKNAIYTADVYSPAFYSNPIKDIKIIDY